MLLTIFIIGAVSASDDIADDSNLTVTEEEILDVSQDEEVLGEMGKWDGEFAAVKSIDLDDAQHTSDFAKIFIKEKQGTAILMDKNDNILYEKELSTFPDSYDKDWGYCFNVSGKDVDDYIKANNVGGNRS